MNTSGNLIERKRRSRTMHSRLSMHTRAFCEKIPSHSGVPRPRPEGRHRGRRCDTLQLVKQLRGGRIAMNRRDKFRYYIRKPRMKPGRKGYFLFPFFFARFSIDFWTLAYDKTCYKRVVKVRRGDLLIKI